MQIYICHCALNNRLLNQHLYLAYFDIYAIQKMSTLPTLCITGKLVLSGKTDFSNSFIKPQRV